jgi:aryl-alcohol dehydrogenase-like predicted oxidoreductase
MSARLTSIAPFSALSHALENLSDGRQGGGVNSKVTNSPEHIRSAIQETIKCLGSAPDLYYLHRIDPETKLEDSIAEMQKLKEEGLTKYIGLSECGAETLRKACKSESYIPCWKEERCLSL